MLVKAKWNVADASGWHMAGEVFETKEDLGDAAEVLIPEQKKPEQMPEEKPEQPAEAQEAPKRTAARRKTAK